MTLSVNDDALVCQKAYIDGKWYNADSDEHFDVINPAINKSIATVAKCGTHETRKAIIATEQALGTWRQTTSQRALSSTNGLA